MEAGHLKLLFLDEARNFMTEALGRGMAMGRAKKGAFVLAFQGLGQIKNQALRQEILSTAGIKVVMGAVEVEDAEYISRAAGSPWLPLRSLSSGWGTGHSVGQSDGFSSGSNYHAPGGLFADGGATGGTHGSSSGSSSAQSRSENYGESLQRTRIPLWEPHELRGLPAAHAVIEWRDGATTPPGPPQTRKVFLERRVSNAALGGWRNVAAYPGRPTKIYQQWVVRWREARQELIKAVERWHGRKAVPPQNEAERLLLAAAEQWVNYWDNMLLQRWVRSLIRREKTITAMGKEATGVAATNLVQRLTNCPQQVFAGAGARPAQ